MAFLVLGKIDVEPLLNAQLVLQEFMLHTTTRQEKTAVIQAFEFCYELSWKTMKRVLEQRGVVAFSPRETIRLAARESLIDNPQDWIKFVEMRNLTVHTYNQSAVDEIFSQMPAFVAILNMWVLKLRSLV